MQKLIGLFLFIVPRLLFASSDTGTTENLTHRMTLIVFQIGVIIFAAKLGGMVFEKIKFPSVLGELTAGIIIGPYMLGSVALPGFESGLFPVSHVFTLPVTPELYAFATVASIVLLFAAGLETDFTMFMKYSFTGVVLGLGGVVVSFVVGDLTAVYFLDVDFMNIKALFLGVMSTATSVGITARILSEKRKMDSPEGVSIMAGAVIDDILGIIVLAIVLGISAAALKGDGKVEWGHIGFVAARAIGVWLAFTLVGVVFAFKISAFLKMFKGVAEFSVLALGMAFITAGVFEKAGLALIVGAYVTGLALSRTDLGFVIHEKLHTVQIFLVPLFFTVMGMLVNPYEFASVDVLIFGCVYTVGAVLAKIVGCGIPSVFLGFNRLGALRIGFAMIPRGEVALIIAGIGLSYGVLNHKIFGVSVFMTLVTTIIAPPLLSMSLNRKAPGTRKKIKEPAKADALYELPSEAIARILEDRILENFNSEGFFINLIEIGYRVYHIKKDAIDITITCQGKQIYIQTDQEDLPFVKNVIYETLIKFKAAISEVQSLIESVDMRNEIIAKGRTNKQQVYRILKPENIVINIAARAKRAIISELIEQAHKSGYVEDAEAVVEAVMEREEVMSTGLADGVAIPHAKTPLISQIALVIGLKKDGVNFESLDGKPSKIFFLLLSPENEASSHLQMVSNITSIFYDEEHRERLLACTSRDEVYSFFAR